MANWLRLQKRTSLVVLSFLASCIYRTVTGAWPLDSSRFTLDASPHGEGHGLLISMDHGIFNRGHHAGRFGLELNGSFPFLHLQSLAPGLVSVAVSHTPCIGKTTGGLEVNAMQFGIGPSSICASSPNAKALFSSNPAPPSTNIGNPPVISIGEGGAGGGEGAHGAPGCGGCGGVSCAGLPSPFCAEYCCYPVGYCDFEGPSCP